jgi:hypothetical protein
MKNFIIIIIIALSLIEIIHMNKKYRVLTFAIKSQIEITENCNNKMNVLKENIIRHWKNENPSFSDSLVLDEKSNIISKNILTNQCPLLIFRFSELNCSTCINNQLSLIIDSLQSKRINYIIISDYKNIRNLGLFKKSNSIRTQVYNCKQLLINETITPYYIILNKNGALSDLFYPDEQFPELTASYLEIISNKYFKNY